MSSEIGNTHTHTHTHARARPKKGCKQRPDLSSSPTLNTTPYTRTHARTNANFVDPAALPAFSAETGELVVPVFAF